MKIVFFILFIPFLLILLPLINNHVLIIDQPGLDKRLEAAFTNNVAETRDGHEYPELRTPVITGDLESVRLGLVLAGEELGWELQIAEATKTRLHFVIKTRWLRFVDDLVVEMSALDENRVTLYIRSQSRKGIGDLGANKRHVTRLLEQFGSHKQQ